MPESEPPRSLHIGCGPTQKRGDMGMDIIPGPAVDIVHDLDSFPWPVHDNSFDLIIAEDVLEHLHDIPAVMGEMYRAAVDGAIVDIKVPSGTSSDVFVDPTHVRGFSFRSFDYFDPSKEYYSYGYSKIRLDVQHHEFIPRPGRAFRFADRIMARVANKWPAFYEDRLSHLYPMRAIRFRIKIVKPPE